MPTQTLDKAVRSLPIRVEFAGFESDTRRLAAAGWDLSMRQMVHARADYNPSLQLAMRLETGSNALFAISRPLDLDYSRLRGVAHLSRVAATPGGDRNTMCYSAEMEITRVMAELGFQIQCVANSIRFAVMPQRHFGVGSFSSSFEPIDAMPQVVEERIEDFKFFKVAKPTVKDLIVNPEDVPELLDAVLRAQKPLMDKIRSKERTRENMKWMENGFEVRAAKEVAAQLVVAT